MGLDMYLSKKTYVQRWDHQSPEETYNVEVTQGGNSVDHIQPNRVSYVEEQVGYWRKANAIHKWFVDNVQAGNDNCSTYFVDIPDLMNLLDVCKEVKNNPEKAEELLPPEGGFFFGDVSIDQYYFHTIDNTIKILEGVLSEQVIAKNGKAFYPSDFYYHSSW
jgi:hypothetical protein